MMREKKATKAGSRRVAPDLPELERPEQGAVMADLRRPIDGSHPADGERGGRSASTDDLVIAVSARLRSEFGAADQQYVESRVRHEFGRWQEARVTQYVPLLVERHVRDELRGFQAPTLPH
jgi:hypothetical protein